MLTTTKSSLTRTPTEKLVDDRGVLQARIAELKVLAAEMDEEIIRRAGTAKRVPGILFSATIITETITSSIDITRLIEEMGERWVDKFRKWSTRKSYVTINAKPIGK